MYLYQANLWLALVQEGERKTTITCRQAAVDFGSRGNKCLSDSEVLTAHC